MGVLRPIDGGWIDSRIPEIGRRLREHDAALTLVAHCEEGGEVQHYVVTWKAPSGREMFVARFDPLTEVEQIIPTIYSLDRRAEGHVDSITAIDAHNAKIEERAAARLRDALAAEAEHRALLKRDLEDGLHFHGQAGWDGPQEEN